MVFSHHCWKKCELAIENFEVCIRGEMTYMEASLICHIFIRNLKRFEVMIKYAASYLTFLNCSMFIL